MQNFLLLLFLLSFSYKKSKFVESVTFGYKEATLGQFVCTAGILRIDNDELIAGATIVHPEYLMSAKINYAYSGYKVRAIAGDIDHFRNSTTPSRQERIVTHYFSFLHRIEGYDSIIMFRLDKPFQMNKFVGVYPIHYKKIDSNTKVLIAGWGRPLYLDMNSKKEFTQYLKYIEVEVANAEDCPFDLTDQKGLWRIFFCFRGMPGKYNLSATTIFDNGSPAYMGKRILGIVSPLIGDWNYVDGRRIEKLNRFQHIISETVAWNGKTPNIYAFPVD